MSISRLTDKTIVETYNYIKFKNLIPTGLNLITLINDTWNLVEYNSKDLKFKNLYDEFYHHIQVAEDWTLEEIFFGKLSIIEDLTNFKKFVESILLPKNQTNEFDTEDIVKNINSFVERDGYEVEIEDYDNNDLPIYILNIKENSDILINDFQENNIQFKLVKDFSGYVNNQTNKYKADSLPCFAIYSTSWDDYGYKNSYYLYYYDQNNICTNIGSVKIMEDNNENTNTLPDSFLSLNDNYCSLGQTDNYYQTIKELFRDNFESILFALKDAALFSFIQEKFENNKKFINSLIRDDDAERLLRETKYKLRNLSKKNLYSFDYLFKPLYSSNNIKINFNFNNEKYDLNRIYAIIGKNGTGKTQLITSIPNDISENLSERFYQKIPLFSKIISVSYSFFDRFSLPKRTTSFNYIYCGLRGSNGSLLSERGLLLRFHNTWKKIESIQRIDKWRKILLTFIEAEIINEFLLEQDYDFPGENQYRVSLKGFKSARNKLSSGQGIVLYIITEIVANIRLDSLIIYDEPETHLHPNAITQLMNTIYELVNEFESYCLIATHSPLIIRELFSRNVYVMERNNNSASIRRIAIESFGENLTTITEEVFGNKEIKKQSKTILRRLVETGKTFDEITKMLEYGDVPLSLNTRILLKSLIKDWDEEH